MSPAAGQVCSENPGPRLGGLPSRPVRPDDPATKMQRARGSQTTRPPRFRLVAYYNQLARMHREPFPKRQTIILWNGCIVIHPPEPRFTLYPIFGS